MTVVTKYAVARAEARQDAKIYPSSGQWMWGNQASESIGFVVGEWLVFRFSLDVPKGATITTAEFRFEYSQKDGAPAQTTNMTMYFEQADNSAPWPYVDGTLISVAPPTFPRTVDAGAAFVISYPGGSTPAADIVTRTITTQIQALVNRAGWEAGNYVTMAMLCTAEGSGADLSIYMNEAWYATQPQFNITYTHDDDTAARSDVNLLLNQEADNTDEFSTQEMSGNAQGGVTYTTTTDPQRGTVLVGVAHPPAGQETRMAIVYQAYVVPEGTYVLSGWFYVPSSSPADFHCEFTFLGGGVDYPQRDVWAPFATTPLTIGAGGSTLWCSMGLAAGPAKAEGNWWMLDDLCVQQTNAMEMPWTGATTDRFNADYEPKETATHGVSVRRNYRRTHVLISSVSRPRRNYVRNKDGLWVRADQERMATWSQFAGATWDTVGTSTTTWDTAS